ncbi:hypothetical protein [Microbacterium sp. KSW4-4]|uniref:hypothetical protein n=1 Tax=Microbacterium sp. KSW4-4 TaxID=2851651 RepID=UPI001FFCA7C3|nr:hypothetical protein [Microbacterium sp. KSW4-4]MCK2032211.1 hypothetical protein [Microbacterium sp. KSW4-4]
MEDDPGRPPHVLNFAIVPEGFRSFAKAYAYELINYGNPESLIAEAHGPYTKWPSAGTIKSAMADLGRGMKWLTGEWSVQHPETPVIAPRDLDSGHLDDLRTWVHASKLGRKTKVNTLLAVRRAWHFSERLQMEHRWPEPSWLLERSLSRGAEENRSIRIRQEIMAPLITWACAFVDEFAEDIFAAHTDYAAAIADTPAAKSFRRDQCLKVLAAYSDYRLPGQTLGNEVGTDQVAWHVVAYQHRAPRSRMAKALWRLSDRERYQYVTDPDLHHLRYSPTALFRDRVWIDGIRVLDVVPRGQARGRDNFSPLMSHLMAACVIVIAYLTGARPEEVAGLEFGAAVDPIQREDGGRLYLIRGKVWKGLRRDDDGKPVPPTLVSWATTRSAWNAARVAERIRRFYGSESGAILSSTGTAQRSSLITDWIQHFIAFVNDRLVPVHEDPEVMRIQADPDGKITLRRFRRTLAWFLSNRPGGDITLALQYQHLRTVMGSGYAGTKESGLNSLLSAGDWEHRKATIQELGHLLAAGESVYGPGAERAVTAVRRLPSSMTPAEERRLRRDPDLVLYDNPAAVALCAYRAATARCTNQSAKGKARPDLGRCDARCANLVRTEAQLMTISSRAEVLRANAALSPTPLARSMVAGADELDELVTTARMSARAAHCD